MINKIEDLIIESRGNKKLVDTYKLLKSNVMRIELDEMRKLSTEEIQKMIMADVADRHATIKTCVDLGRDDLVEEAKIEIEALNKLLPEKKSKEETLEIIEGEFAKYVDTKLPPKAIGGKIFGALSPIKKELDWNFVTETINNTTSEMGK